MSLEADGYGQATRRNYGETLDGFAVHLASVDPQRGPCEATRNDVRGWLVDLRRTRSQNTARTRYAGLRHIPLT